MTLKSLLIPALGLTACAPVTGQKVTMLLLQHKIDCQVQKGDDVATASFLLEQPDDFYLATFQRKDSNEAFTLASTRVGNTVTFVCPDGFDQIIVKHASVLQQHKSEDGQTGGSFTPVQPGN